ncbi:MAG: hypothetical protein KAR06_11075 [Deltaproteobacteria bacterium]|nr:hypothetical protein [Deltaproteobacteria bacterium]
MIIAGRVVRLRRPSRDMKSTLYHFATIEGRIRLFEESGKSMVSMCKLSEKLREIFRSTHEEEKMVIEINIPILE